VAYDAESVAEAYGRWFASGPFDCGNTTRRALRAAANVGSNKAAAARAAADPDSQGNGSLMRVAPIGIWAGSAAEAAAAAIADSVLTHPNPVCRIACGAYAAAISAGVHGAGSPEMARIAMDVARSES